ncbi:mycothiol-dependent nitroreductase Rv2466c family protein [Tomitella cavernea]|uniref:mycothiol-dependent nitroreductase Rv2466c family protein n=1 Tax=Tomitella cavernea TaxID=1387982 RepID=UPI0019073C51|nr:DsbA family protein [Tomitella cavernea]
MTDAESGAQRTVVVDVWFDPVCPYTWVTTRWLATAAQRRRVELRWHLMSLAVLNAGKNMGEEETAEMADSRAAGRLLAAVAQEQDGDLLSTVYTAMGERYHRRAQQMDHDLASAALAECGADPTLADAMEDSSYDDYVERSHAAGQRALGDTGGSPIVSIDGTAFFGPVLMSIPGSDEAASLFDAVTALGHAGAFSQIKRPRSGAPDVG